MASVKTVLSSLAILVLASSHAYAGNAQRDNGSAGGKGGREVSSDNKDRTATSKRAKEATATAEPTPEAGGGITYDLDVEDAVMGAEATVAEEEAVTQEASQGNGGSWTTDGYTGMSNLTKAVNNVDKNGPEANEGSIANEMEGVSVSQIDKPGTAGVLRGKGREALLDRLNR